MGSAKPKVLHCVAGHSLIAHTLGTVAAAGSAETAVVVGAQAERVIAEVKRLLPGSEIFVQHERQGTAHAVLAARAAIARKPDDVLIVFADTPLLRTQTLIRM